MINFFIIFFLVWVRWQVFDDQFGLFSLGIPQEFTPLSAAWGTLWRLDKLKWRRKHFTEARKSQRVSPFERQFVHISSLDRNKRLLSISWSDGLISEWPLLQGILMLELKVSTMGLGVRHVFWGVTWKDSTALICRGLSFTCVNACSPCHKMTGSFDESSPIFLNHKNLFPLFEWSDL